MSLGKAKFYFERIKGYSSSVQFLMLAFLFLKEYEIRWEWILIALPVSIFLSWFDAKYVLPDELAEFMKKNPEWKKQFGRESK